MTEGLPLVAAPVFTGTATGYRHRQTLGVLRDGQTMYAGDSPDLAAKAFCGFTRGGFSWPWPRQNGAAIDLTGAAVVVAIGRDGVAHAIGWGTFTSIGPSREMRDGIAARQGLSGVVRSAIALDNCTMWTGWHGGDDAHYDGVRTLRKCLPGLEPALRVRPLEGIPATAAACMGVIAQWAEAERLDVPEELTSLIEVEESRNAESRPWAEALAAALRMAGERPPRWE